MHDWYGSKPSIRYTLTPTACTDRMDVSDPGRTNLNCVTSAEPRCSHGGGKLAGAAGVETPRDYANDLATRPTRDDPQWRPWPAARLLLACLVPRLLMACRVDSVSPTGSSISNWPTDRAGPLDPDDVIICNPARPFALATLHRLGIGWENAAQVLRRVGRDAGRLPLFGWAHRQFDDRVAVLACRYTRRIRS